jgi:hypothetical protein
MRPELVEGQRAERLRQSRHAHFGCPDGSAITAQPDRFSGLVTALTNRRREVSSVADDCVFAERSDNTSLGAAALDAI